MVKIPEKLIIEETRAIIRLYLFLRHECGLREADKLSARELKNLPLRFAFWSGKIQADDSAKTVKRTDRDGMVS